MIAIRKKLTILALASLAVLALLTVSVGCTPTSSSTSAPIPTPIATRSPTSPSTGTVAQANLDQAGSALVSFFDALNEGRYADAVPLYGGDYDMLRDWNPNTAPDDYPKLFEGGCRTNGLQCLKVKDVVKAEQVSPTDLQLTVEFQNPDGTPFEQGPCCGDNSAEQPTRTQFDYIVVKRGEQFLVQGLPVYTP